jgi:hypothetical protein
MPAADEIIASGRLFLYHLSEYNPQTRIHVPPLL